MLSYKPLNLAKNDGAPVAAGGCILPLHEMHVKTKKLYSPNGMLMGT